MSGILFASDIDGTLLQKGELPKENVEAIRKLQRAGHKFCVVTGRDLGMIPYEIVSLCDYFVAINGAAVFDGQRNPIYLNPFEKEKFKKIFDIAYPTDLNKLWIHGADRYYEELRDGTVNNTPKTIYSNYVSLEEILQNDVYEMSFDINLDKVDFFNDIYNQIRNLGGVTVYSYSLGCDIMPSDCTKASGLRKLDEKYHFDKVYAAGDAGNDIEMIKEFESFAVNSKNEEINKNADHIVSSIAEAIESLHLY